jgi:hypothetical protein
MCGVSILDITYFFLRKKVYDLLANSLALGQNLMPFLFLKLIKKEASRQLIMHDNQPNDVSKNQILSANFLKKKEPTDQQNLLISALFV